MQRQSARNVDRVTFILIMWMLLSNLSYLSNIKTLWIFFKQCWRLNNSYDSRKSQDEKLICNEKKLSLEKKKQCSFYVSTQKPGRSTFKETPPYLVLTSKQHALN